jgi:surface antigen
MKGIKMKSLKAIGIVALLMAVAACAPTRMAQTTTTQPTVMAAPMPASLPPSMDMPTPPQTQSEPIQQARINPGNLRFIDTTAAPLLSAAARSAATDAQFYALQFGRPGAPRNWSSGGQTGSVSVGPYVRVNNLDCREFTHRATISGQTYSRSGTACREADGSWDVVDA